MSNNTKQEEHALRRAKEARLGLAADLRDIQRVSGRLIRASEKRIKNSAVVIGIVVLGGIGVGLAIRAMTSSHRSPRTRKQDPSVIRGLVSRAAVALGAKIATRMIEKLASPNQSPRDQFSPEA